MTERGPGEWEVGRADLGLSGTRSVSTIIMCKLFDVCHLPHLLYCCSLEMLSELCAG